jgi:hypothetical protein
MFAWRRHVIFICALLVSGPIADQTPSPNTWCECTFFDETPADFDTVLIAAKTYISETMAGHCEFKIGITENPYLRWTRDDCGYEHSGDWKEMVLLYAANTGTKHVHDSSGRMEKLLIEAFAGAEVGCINGNRLEAPAQGVLAAPTAPASLATAAPAELEAPAHHLGVLAAPAAPASLATAAPAHAAPNLPLPEVTPPSGSAAPSGATLLDAMLERDTERKAAAAAAKKAEKEALKAAKEKEEAAAAAAKKAEKEALEPIKAATAKEEVDDKGEAEKPVASCKAEAKKPATPKQSVAPTKLVDAEAEVKSAQPKKASCKIGAKKRIGVNHEGSICQYLARSATISKGFKYGPGKTYETAELAKEAAAAWLDTMRTTSAQG